MKTAVTTLLLVLAAALAQAGPLVHGEGTDQLSAGDIRDLEDLAEEILPGSRVAAIDAVVRKDGEHAGEVALLHVFAEPDRETSRIWHGLFFKCMPEFAYHPPTLSTSANAPARAVNPTTHRRGRWIAQFADPARHYAVISLPGQMLPGFSSNFLDHYSPFDFGKETDLKDAVAAYDFVLTSGPQHLSSQNPVDLKTEPVHFLQVSKERATVTLGRFKFELKRNNSPWQIGNVKTYGATFGGIIRRADEVTTQKTEKTPEKSPDEEVADER